MNRGYALYSLTLAVVIIYLIATVKNHRDNEEAMIVHRAELEKDIDNLKECLVLDEELKNSIDQIIKRSPAVGGMITEIKETIDNVDISEDLLNQIAGLPETDHEIIVKERVLNNGLRLYKYSKDIFIYPVYDKENSYVTSEYGHNYIWKDGRKILRLHRGVDIVSRFDMGVRSVLKGVVIEVGYNKNHGKFIAIQSYINSERYRVLYAHLSTTNVKPFEKVEQGHHIALIGNTGGSLGAHLHYEIHLQAESGRYYTVNPFYNSTYSLPVELKSFRPVIYFNIDK
jgi:murein DD-endopeptidase MepM/ murein hydrolase activator NlpD